MDTLVPGNNQELVTRLLGLNQEIGTEINDLFEEDANFQGAENEWGIKQIICHLRDAEQIYSERLRKMLGEDEPYLRAFNPDELAIENAYKEAKWEEVRKEYNAARQANLDILTALKPVQWLKGAIHQERGHITVHDIAEALVSHNENHLEQIRHVRWLAK